MDSKRYITQPQVKQRYGSISDMTVWRWIKAGRLPEPALFGNRNYFDISELDEADRRAKEQYRRARAESGDHTAPLRKNAE
ncbi:helix-turn-helix transcriptional regulator [Rhizobium ruizarguesonis]